MNIDAGATSDLHARYLQANALHERGQLETAERHYREILAIHPQHGPTLAALGALALQNEDPIGAIEVLTQAIQLLPRSALAHANLANAMLMLDRADEALRCLSNALAIEPAFVGARYNRGCVLMQQRSYAEALTDFQRVLELEAENADAANNAAMALLALNQPVDAIAQFHRALQLQPEWVTPRVNEGIALLQLSRPVEALAACDAALALEPTSVDAIVCRADSLVDLKRFEEAVAGYERALSLAPNDGRALTNVAKALVELNRHAIALLPVNRALALDPHDGRALNIRGVCLSRVGAQEDALLAFERAQQIPGDDAVDAAFNAGDALMQLHRPAEAAERFSSVVESQPDRPHALGRALHAQLLACDWSQYESHSMRVIEAIRMGRPADGPFSFLSLPATSADQLECARLFAPRTIADQVERPRVPLTDRRIRVAYLSADFREHPVAQLAGPLLERHDRSRFEVIGVCLQPLVKSESADRFRSACERFADVSQLSDAEAATLLRELQIDIAVDLTGYTMGERSGILARRPAPVQVGYLGFPGTSGSSFIDYLIADEMVIPESHDRFYSETIVRMPHSFFPADWKSRPALTYSRSDACLPQDAFVFCAFAAAYKISPAIFDIWMRLLQQIPRSVLWLRSGPELQMANLRREALARGVDSKRLVFAPPETPERHLARYAVADIFLDTHPYGAHTTAMEALKAGLPILTCAGETFASRIAASQLCTLELINLITESMSEYEALALRLATEPTLLCRYRDKLQAALEGATQPLDRYCRNLESAYDRMIHLSKRSTDSQPL